VDLNCEALTENDLGWADIVCFSAMLPQKPSLFQVAERCRAAHKLIVFGGHYPTACAAECAPHCDVQVLNEGEITWPAFLEDLERGIYKDRYTSEEKPDVSSTPVPRFELLNIDEYGIIPIQFSRGPVSMRVLRHHRHVRPQAKDQDTGSVAAGAGGGA